MESGHAVTQATLVFIIQRKLQAFNFYHFVSWWWQALFIWWMREAFKFLNSWKIFESANVSNGCKRICLFVIGQALNGLLLVFKQCQGIDCTVRRVNFYQLQTLHVNKSNTLKHCNNSIIINHFTLERKMQPNDNWTCRLKAIIQHNVLKMYCL